MHASLLRDFFLGAVDASGLRADLVGTVTRTSHDVFSHRVVDMDSDFAVSTGHLIALCDAALSGELSPSELSTIATCMELSERFEWDNDTREGEVVEQTLAQWSSSEINYPLTPATLGKFRHLLVTVEDTFTRDDIASQHARSSNHLRHLR